MPKMKTHSGAKKRFRLTASGKVRFSTAYMRHLQRKKSSSMKRKARGTAIMFKSDGEKVKRFFLPNG